MESPLRDNDLVTYGGRHMAYPRKEAYKWGGKYYGWHDFEVLARHFEWDHEEYHSRDQTGIPVEDYENWLTPREDQDTFFLADPEPADTGHPWDLMTWGLKAYAYPRKECEERGENVHVGYELVAKHDEWDANRYMLSQAHHVPMSGLSDWLIERDTLAAADFAKIEESIMGKLAAEEIEHPFTRYFDSNPNPQQLSREMKETLRSVTPIPIPSKDEVLTYSDETGDHAIDFFSEGKRVSDGGSTSYYELPDHATELRHLISAKGMSKSRGDIFKACYRMGEKAGSDAVYDIRKIIFFAQDLLEMHERGEHI